MARQAREAADPPTDDHAGRAMVGGRNLPIAIAVGVLLATLFLGSLFWRPEAFVLVVVALLLLAVVESTRILRRVRVRLLIVPLAVGSVTTVIAAAYAGARGQAIGMAVLFGTSVLWLLFDPNRRRVVSTLGATLLFGIWLGLLASYASLLVVRDDGPVVVLAVIGAATLTDIGGYAFGVTMGRHKVVPSISPNKSWEGLIGGLVVAGLLAALVLPRLGDTFTSVEAAALAVVCGLASFVGDLFESMVKRDLGVKDLGDLLPGHGGILDRVDGILFALPVGVAILAVAG
jgi:phosphatidate cytidylyltransferase